MAATRPTSPVGQHVRGSAKSEIGQELLVNTSDGTGDPRRMLSSTSSPSTLSRSPTAAPASGGHRIPIRRSPASEGLRGQPSPERGHGRQPTVLSDAAILTVSEWAFPSSEVTIEQGEDGVLGRGSYGEVRLATWRGLKVAAKQLHALSGAQAANLSPEQATEVRRDLLKEMQLLSSLRHPNLLLFLGVTIDSHSGGPLSIITELMPSSIYDLLVTRGVRLNRAEVLDLAADIGSGLAYLHGHSPSIVHRDLSSRNVLYDGRTAKLADLGQAKAMGGAVSTTGSRQTAMPGAMVYAAPEVLTGRYTTSIDVFSFGVVLAQLITGEYPRLDTRKDQIRRAGELIPALKPLVERCLCLHAEDRPTAADAARALENLRGDPCTYQPARHGAGVLADRWFRAEQKELIRGLEARLRVQEKRMSADLGRWRAEADRADALSGRIGGAEAERDAAVKRREELEESLNEALGALEAERTVHSTTKEEMEKEKEHGRSLEAKIKRITEDLLRSQRALKSSETLQSLAEGNSKLGNDAAKEAKDGRLKAETRAAQAEAQLAGQVAATREAETRLTQAISRWEGEKVDRLRFRKDFLTKCNEAQDRERTVRDLQTNLKEALERLSKYDGMPESQQIRQRLLDLEEDRKRADDQTALKERELEDKVKGIQALVDKVGNVETERDAALEEINAAVKESEQAQQDRDVAERKSERAARALEKARKQMEDQRIENDKLKEETAEVRKEIKRVKKDAPWLFKGGGRGTSSDRPRGRSGSQASGDDAAGQEHDGHLPDPGTFSTPDLRNLPSLGFPSLPSDSDNDEEIDYDRCLGEASATGARGIVDLLGRYPKRQEVQRRGMRALRDFAYKGDEERAAVAAAGGVMATVRAMERSPGDERLQRGGMKTLAHLAFGNDVNRIEVGSAGGIGAILRGMAAFPSEADIQGEGCTAVTNLSHNCDRNRRYVVEGGGLVLILNAMQAFPGNPKLQRQACWALLTLAANDEISRMIASEGGIGAIIAAMINNAGDTSVQHFGCWALANVGWGQATVQKFAREEGAMEAIQTAVHRFPSHHALVAKARLASAVILNGTGLEPL